MNCFSTSILKYRVFRFQRFMLLTGQAQVITCFLWLRSVRWLWLPKWDRYICYIPWGAYEKFASGCFRRSYATGSCCRHEGSDEQTGTNEMCCGCALLYYADVLERWLQRDDFNDDVIDVLPTTSTATSTAASMSAGCAVLNHVKKSTTWPC